MQPITLFLQGVSLGGALFVWSLFYHAYRLIGLALTGWLDPKSE